MNVGEQVHEKDDVSNQRELFTMLAFHGLLPWKHLPWKQSATTRVVFRDHIHSIYAYTLELMSHTHTYEYTCKRPSFEHRRACAGVGAHAGMHAILQTKLSNWLRAICNKRTCVSWSSWM